MGAESQAGKTGLPLSSKDTSNGKLWLFKACILVHRTRRIAGPISQAPERIMEIAYVKCLAWVLTHTACPMEVSSFHCMLPCLDPQALLQEVDAEYCVVVPAMPWGGHKPKSQGLLGGHSHRLA